MLTFESHSHQLLAMSSVLLLSQKFPEAMGSIFFTNNSLTTLKRSVHQYLGIGNWKFSRIYIIEILDIVNSLTKKEITREAVSLAVLNLA